MEATIWKDYFTYQLKLKLRIFGKRLQGKALHLGNGKGSILSQRKHISKYIPSHNDGEQLQRKDFIIDTTRLQICQGDVL